MVGDPADMRRMNGCDKARLESRCPDKINHVRFLGPHEKFNFSCKRLNTCCENFTQADRVPLDPYDIYRLSRNKKMSTGQLIEKHVDIVLDADTHIPLAFLRFRGEEGRNKCHFLGALGCSVYPDRPLRCRLLPLGKISSAEKSYFVLINNCPCGNEESDDVWSVTEWLQSSECHPFLKNQEAISAFFDDYYADTFKALPEKMKLEFGSRLYDVDSFASQSEGSGKSADVNELMRRLSAWVKDYLVRYGCLKIENEAAAI